jgi:hypothetical protein
MSIAFYVPELNNSELNIEIYKCLNDAVENNKSNDASLFINNVNFMDKPVKFGVFNSTELWNYTGLLVTTTLDLASFARSVVNKFTHVFYAGNKPNNLMAFIDTINNVPAFVLDAEEQKEVKRITGKILPILTLDAASIQQEFVK